ncbi:MAG: FadR family transcriptional regulator [Sandaracinaceae bacterium]|nr:FadR family transcriptional regulator [Sandaracinaceae bacterium]
MKTPLPPSRLERTRLSSQAAGALKRAIVTGAYPAGSRLPTEKVLAEQLGVTRLTLREALSQLSSAGFVVTRHGSGTYVVDVRERENLQLLADMLAAGRELSPRESAALLELRAVVACGFAQAIAAGATAEHVAALRELVAGARRTREPAELAAIDYRINELLALASGNVFYTLLMRSLREVHVALATVVYREVGDVEVILSTLEALASALERGPKTRFERVLRTYVDGAAPVLAKRFGPSRTPR